ncbi:polyadenylate-binding protein 8 [Citrus sinensis]|uniref:Polyadenylate-binding protein 8 n=1 Tax=Citrus sinensis TaxID=2711 RepID=A0ACB8ISV3_CITSI|nr:polyadenylate-binding protein 8 [Citrus sinensis]
MEVSLRAHNNNDSAILGTLFSLYVGDLDSTVTEQQLIQTFSFSKLEGLASAMLCVDSFHRRSLRYGYANFHSFHCATKAIEALNYTILNGKAIRNLASTIDNWKLHQIFSKFGDIQSSKLQGYGFVQYSTPESALNAIEKLYAATVEGMELILAAAFPNERKDILGQRLYPLLKKLKITEMLLEMDHSELLVLLDSLLSHWLQKWKKQRNCLSSQKVKKVIRKPPYKKNNE